MSVTGVSSMGRMALIDALKAIGSQFIVLHHLAFYGPMSDWTQRMLPDLIDWLSQDARMAVQIFLVVGGFLAARSLAPRGVLLTPEPLMLLRKRYLRTAAPYLAALLLSLLCTELARYWMSHDSLPERAELGQFLAHALLLHSLLGVDSISAGVWYVAIDFQLFALLLGLLWLARALNGRLALSATLLLLGVILSLYGFNLDPDWDIWAVYFLGSYGLGALTYWATQPRHGLKGLGWLLLFALLVLGALAVQFRERIALALMVALLLGAAQQGQWLQRWPQGASGPTSARFRILSSCSISRWPWWSTQSLPALPRLTPGCRPEVCCWPGSLATWLERPSFTWSSSRWAAGAAARVYRLIHLSQVVAACERALTL